MALLGHVQSRGFEGALKIIGNGFDDDGREMLSFVDGETEHRAPWSDVGVVRLGALLRELHDAASSFEPPEGCPWQRRASRELGAALGFGHGDIGPWNVVASDGIPVALIDWEYAGPMDPIVDLAEAAYLTPSFVTMMSPTMTAYCHPLRSGHVDCASCWMVASSI